MDQYLISSNSLEKFYHINGNYFGKQYKEHLSGFNGWEQKRHAEDWVLFPENMGENLSLDETSLSNGELYTILTNKAGKGRKGSLIAMVEGTRPDSVIKILNKIPLRQRNRVKEVTVDMAHSMHKIVRSSFPGAHRVVDRFHVQKLAYEALQEMRIQHRWDAINEATNDMENARLNRKEYIPKLLANGDTKKQLLARSRYLLFKSAEKWTPKQKERANILFQMYPDIKKAMG